TAIDCKAAGAAVNVVEPMTALEVALMVLVPLAATTVASPPAVIVATEVVAEFHVTEPVMFETPPSLNVPVAVNCCVNPFAPVGFAGVTAIDCRAAGPAVNVV